MNPGVLLFNLGGPETLDDVKPFLYNLFKDPEILRIRWGPLRNTLAYVIATLRRRTSEGYYRQIGGSSPLRRITTEQAEALRKELASHGSKVETFVAMSSWHPFFEEAIASVEDRAINRLVVLPLFPQYSATTTGSGFSSIRRLIEDRPLMKKVDVRWVRSWHEHPTYIEAFAGAIGRELECFPNPTAVHLIFSAHSVPESYVRSGDPYLDETRRSVERIMDRVGRANRYRLAFQSKIGPLKWLEPFTNDVIVELARQGAEQVLVVPISFVSEHIETLYELDILYRKVAEGAGIRHFRRVPALNCNPTFIRALGEIVEATIRQEEPDSQVPTR